MWSERRIVMLIERGEINAKQERVTHNQRRGSHTRY